ncbi:MAG: class I tRNA ligase family protein, partial [Phycisphaerales bacterium]
APLARNTSSKFDIGRAFCNKLWNAVRFAISNLDHVGSADRTLTLPDRWMLTRLHRAVHRIEDAVAAYQVNTYADAIYDLARRDFCDWYLEAIKPTIQSSPQQQIVLRCVLDSILRLLHPICPFITETLWPHVRSKQNDANATIPGITLGPSDLLATAPWPDIACSIEDASGHDAFERIRNLVEAIRALRGEHKVPDKRRITLCASPDVFDLINSSGPVAAALAGLETIKPFDRSAAESGDQVVVFTFEGQEQLLLDLAEAADPAVERARLEQEVTALEKSIAALSGRLNNPGYAQKAPEKLVNETRQQLADAERERTLKQAAIDRLGR